MMNIFLKRLSTLPFLLFCFTPLFWLNVNAQTQYATSVLSESHVSNSGNSIDSDEITYSELEASSGLVIGIGAYNSHIELEFPSTLPAEQTFYVKIETDDDLLSALVGGTLGELVSDVLGVVLLGNQEFTVEVKNGANTVLSGNSAIPSTFAGERLKAVLNKNGEAYLVITPGQDFQSIRITNRVGSLVGLNTKKRMRVYDPYYVINPVPCPEPKFTSYSGTGISLELLNLGGGVSNIENMIDQDFSTHSTLSLGVVSVASSLRQYAYFEAPSLATDVYGISFSIDPALLNVGIAQNVRIITQNGALEVSNEPLTSYLTASNLTELGNGQSTIIYFSPNAPVNRIVVDFNGLLGVTLLQSLEIDEVFLITNPPELDMVATDTMVCEGSTADLLATLSDPSKEIRWYTAEGAVSPINVTSSGTVVTIGPLTNDTTLWIASGAPGCEEESIRIPILVEVAPAPTLDDILSNVSPHYCASDSVIVSVESEISDVFGWYFDSDLTNPVTTSQNNDGYSYYADNDSLTVYGITPGDSVLNLYVTYQDTANGCWNLQNEALAIALLILDEPMPTTASTDQLFCPTDNPTVADIDVNESNVNWYDLDGNVLAPSDILIDGADYFVTTFGADCESADTLTISVSISDLPAPTATSSEQTFCSTDNPVVADIEVNEPNVNWYDIDGNLLLSTDLLVDGTEYFATTYDANCESADTLTISITVSTLPAPTTSNTSQLFCPSDNPTIADIDVNESNVNWYDVDGNGLSGSDLLVDGADYFATTSDGNCESGDTLTVSISISDLPAPTTVSTEQLFCSTDNPTVADIDVNESNVNWYDFDGNLLASTDLLVDGTDYFATTYTANCESAGTLTISVSISDLPSPTAASTNQTFCSTESPTVADIQVNESNVNWYDVDGNLLTSSDLLVDGAEYFATTYDANCESADSLTVSVSLTTLLAPTSSSTSQIFCPADNATVGDIDANGTNTINWYDVDGNSLSSSDLLIDGESYYAISVDGDCESADTLIVSITITALPAPTTSNTDQTFCSIDNPTVADIDVNEININWYDAEGNLLASTDMLIDGAEYFATSFSINCESVDTLVVSVSVATLIAPTTSDAVQTFCAENNPTIGDLDVNESSIQWYDTEGNSLTIDTPLLSGEYYYASIVDGDCESDDRLEVQAVIEDSYSANLTTDSEDICLHDTVSYHVGIGMTDYNWTVEGGTIISGGIGTDNTIEITWNDTLGGSLHVSYISEHGCLLQIQDTLLISVDNCSDLTINKMVNNTEPMIGEVVEFTITVANNGVANLTGVVVDEQLQSGFTYVSHQASNGVYDVNLGEWNIPVLAGGEVATLVINAKVNSTGNYTNTATITATNENIVIEDSYSVVELFPDCLTIYNEISPNGDGINDYLQIDCIEQHPDNSLHIFNRFGNLVYHVEGYNNDWTGFANVSGVVSKGEPLPIGTYFYILEIKEVDLKVSGWIYIVR